MSSDISAKPPPPMRATCTKILGTISEEVFAAKPPTDRAEKLEHGDPAGTKDQDPGTKGWDPGYQVPGTWYQVPGTRFQVPGPLKDEPKSIKMPS